MRVFVVTGEMRWVVIAYHACGMPQLTAAALPPIARQAQGGAELADPRCGHAHGRPSPYALRIGDLERFSAQCVGTVLRGL
jgi:hypothetical protein